MTIDAVDWAEYPVWRDLVQRRLGLWFGPRLASLLRERLSDRARALGMDGLEAYRRHLERRPAEWEELANVLTIQEGRFFRQPDVFTALEEEVLPRLIRRRLVADRRDLRFWSAGCGAGEELYSLAILLLESVAAPDRWDLRLLGTDISQASIERARAGRYHATRLTGVGPDRLQRWFEPAGASGVDWRVRVELRERCTFVARNLNDPNWNLPPQDIILCLNVLFYLPDEDARSVAQRLKETLAPGGVLVIGAAEAAVLEGGEIEELHAGLASENGAPTRARVSASPRTAISASHTGSARLYYRGWEA